LLNKLCLFRDSKSTYGQPNLFFAVKNYRITSAAVERKIKLNCYICCRLRQKKIVSDYILSWDRKMKTNINKLFILNYFNPNSDKKILYSAYYFKLRKKILEIYLWNGLDCGHWKRNKNVKSIKKSIRK
jgi:hypothetical protein